MKDKFKVFIVHRGRHPYLKYVINEALKWHNEIILLSDDKELTKNYLGVEITIENISDYFGYAKEFEELYVHMSINSPSFEKFCIERRLIIFEYMEKHNMNACGHIDSDVLLFCNLENKHKQLNNCDFGYVRSCGHVFLGTKKGLENFKDFIFCTYKNNLDTLKDYNQLKWKIEYSDFNYQKVEDHNNGCVSDMTLINLFIKNHNKNLVLKDIGRIRNGEVFDHDINSSEGFEYRFIKKILLFDNQYFGKINQKLIKFKCLHFIGDAKHYLKYFYYRDIGCKLYSSLFLYKFFVPVFIKFSQYLGLYKFMLKLYGKYRKHKYGITGNLQN